MSGINDFVVKFANVNGSGSASANEMFAKALFRMGIPVSPKNIFPSNIQGLATWYEVRASGAGYVARRDGVDICVAMNPQTYAQDVREVRRNGWLMYDSTMHREFARDYDRPDIEMLAIPIAKMCADTWKDARQRQLFKNMVYVGALIALLDIDIGVVRSVVGDQLKGKEKLLDANMKALELGRTYAKEHFQCPLPIRAVASEAAKGKILVSGNEAGGLGAVFAGASVCAWYPITPSTSLPEGYEKHAKRLRVDKDGRKTYAIVQAEDELAAIGIAIGAGWNGARAFTATSGPGISLMSEFLGLAYFAEIPVVLYNVQRGGPSTGMPTRTQQSDVMSCAYASHGDKKHVLLFPADPGECFSMSQDAFDLAERLQTPVIVMSDLDIGMNQWMCDPLKWDYARPADRGKVLDAAALEGFAKAKNVKQWGRYLDVDGDAVPYRTLPGTHPAMGAFFTRGTSHDELAGYTEDGRVNARNMERLARKHEYAKTVVPKPEIGRRELASRIGIVYFGATRPAVVEATDQLAKDGIGVDTLRIRAFPFTKEVEEFCAAHETLFVVEQNRDAQMRSLLMIEAGVPAAKMVAVTNIDGMPLTAAFVAGAVRKHARPERAAAE